jgi:hypothetical protein
MRSESDVPATTGIFNTIEKTLEEIKFVVPDSTHQHSNPEKALVRDTQRPKSSNLYRLVL